MIRVKISIFKIASRISNRTISRRCTTSGYTISWTYFTIWIAVWRIIRI